MGLFRRVVTLGRRSQMEREIDAELREHMQMCIDDSVAAGMSREAAEHEARLRFGVPWLRGSVSLKRMRRSGSRVCGATCEWRCAGS